MHSPGISVNRLSQRLAPWAIAVLLVLLYALAVGPADMAAR